MKHPITALQFDLHPWQVSTSEWNNDSAMHQETLFAVANGYLGTRGTMEEQHGNNHQSCEGTYLNGVYSREKITYGEVAYGYASHNQKMLQVPNGKVIQLEIDGQRAHIQDAQSSCRTLDLANAVFSRTMHWQSASNKKITLQSDRFASLSRPNLLCIRIQLEAVNFEGKVKLSSLLDADYGFAANPDDPRVGQLNMAESLQLITSEVKDLQASMLHRVRGSSFVVSSAISHTLPDNVKSVTEIHHNQQIGFDYELELKANQPVTLIKYVSYQHSEQDNPATLEQHNKQLLDEASQLGWQPLYQEHQQQVADFWLHSDVEINGDPALQQGIRFNLLHLFMSAGKNGKSNIAAKGLTGHGYDGHYFWDSEVYVVPFLLASNPALARQFLSFRYQTLDAARQRARQMSHKIGALYPWRTIGGEECSAFFPAGTAQYHINSAIAHAIKAYFNATRDWDFMCRQGAEMLFETARLWVEIGHFSARHNGQFCIDMVTGPDEYSALVNNNFYTNAMAREHLQFSVTIAKRMQQDYPEQFGQLCQDISLQPQEWKLWAQAADKMYLAFDDELGINPQDDSFLDREKWDFDNTPAEHYPLLLHYHPLVIYRHQVLKQADVVLAMYMLDDKFSLDLKARNLAYYEPLTTHDSTLSSCIHSIEYAETGDFQLAYQFYHDTVRMDLDNLHGNTEHGVHTACMAGSWMGIVHGFAGVRYRNDELYFAPHLPASWQSYRFNLTYLGRHIQVGVEAEQVSYQLLSGEPLCITHVDAKIELVPHQTITVSL
ncbi:glycoside hydrolase family 65 protein [Neptunicella sp. SCSIO 80796]|uniref:glycoside hydrolase family 65 protein n=1 Tax=Neptunicella plasticusilytica TaxID=3117012 RepID=UPI003A4E049E